MATIISQKEEEENYIYKRVLFFLYNSPIYVWISFWPLDSTTQRSHQVWSVGGGSFQFQVEHDCYRLRCRTTLVAAWMMLGYTGFLFIFLSRVCVM